MTCDRLDFFFFFFTQQTKAFGTSAWSMKYTSQRGKEDDLARAERDSDDGEENVWLGGGELNQ